MSQMNVVSMFMETMVCHDSWSVNQSMLLT